MSKVYFGKFDSRRPHQIQEKYYAAGAKESTWYGGIEPGDFVFVVTNANVIALWKVREYGHKVNPINPSDTGVVFLLDFRNRMFTKCWPMQSVINAIGCF